MEDRMMKFYSKESNMLALHAMHGHFATSHSHINYYVDVTSIKTRVAEAKQAAHVLYSRIPKTKYVDTIGVCIMFVMVAIATGIIIYRSKTRLHYTKTDDTVVENFKEWKHEKDERKALRKSIETALWCMTFVLYFVISFSTGKWYITWVIFLVAGAVENIIRACFDLKK